MKGKDREGLRGNPPAPPPDGASASVCSGSAGSRPVVLGGGASPGLCVTLSHLGLRREMRVTISPWISARLWVTGWVPTSLHGGLGVPVCRSLRRHHCTTPGSNTARLPSPSR